MRGGAAIGCNVQQLPLDPWRAGTAFFGPPFSGPMLPYCRHVRTYQGTQAAVLALLLRLRHRYG